MRDRILITLCALLLTGESWAQPVLERADIGDVTLDVYSIAWTENAFIEGENVTWVFPSASSEALGSADYIAATGTPYADQFPSCERAIFGATNSYSFHSYYSSTDSTYEVVAEGFGIGGGLELVYVDPARLLRFPFHYGDSYLESFQIEGEEPRSGMVTYAGYGTLITPFGTFSDVVKVTGPFEDITFWNKSPLYVILSISYDWMGTFSVPSGSVDMIEELNDAHTLLFPNPAQSELTISNMMGWTAFTVVDPLGRVVIPRRSLTGQLSQQVVLSTLTPGPYLVIGEGPKGPQAVRFVKERSDP